MEILGPDQAQCILEIGPQGEICSNESFFVLCVHDCLGMAEHRPIHHSAENKGIGLTAEFRLDFIQCIAVDWGHVLVILGLDHIL